MFVAGEPVVEAQWRSALGVLPSPLWGGVGGGGPSVDHRTTPPRRFAPTLPTSGRVGPSSRLADSTSHEYGAALACWSWRRHRERLGAGQEPRPRALRQGNTVAHSFTQDAVAALARKVDAFDAVGRRKRCNEAREAIRLAEDAFAIAKHGKIERDRDAVEIRRIELAAGVKGGRDDRVADGEAAEALDHKGEAGALWSAKRQQRRELPGVGGVASLRVQPPAERNLAPGIARAHHLSHGDIRRGHIDQ